MIGFPRLYDFRSSCMQSCFNMLYGIAMAAVEAGFEESLSQFGECFPPCRTEKGDKEHSCFKERHSNYFTDMLWQVIDFSVIAVVVFYSRLGATDVCFRCPAFKCFDARSDSKAKRSAV